jgi:hypothetical protein
LTVPLGCSLNLIREACAIRKYFALMFCLSGALFIIGFEWNCLYCIIYIITKLDNTQHVYFCKKMLAEIRDLSFAFNLKLLLLNFWNYMIE